MFYNGFLGSKQKPSDSGNDFGHLNQLPKNDVVLECIGGLQDVTTGEPVSLTKVSTLVEIHGFVAQVTTNCVYKNESDAQEVMFNYILPYEAALFDFRAEIRGQLVVAEIKVNVFCQHHFALTTCRQ